jgi:hypothetical protein
LEVSTTPSSRNSSNAWTSSASAFSGPSAGRLAKAPNRPGVLRDQLGVPVVDRPADPRSEVRVVVEPGEVHRHRHHLCRDPLPIHVGQRGFGRPLHRNRVTPGRFEAPRQQLRDHTLRHRVSGGTAPFGQVGLVSLMAPHLVSPDDNQVRVYAENVADMLLNGLSLPDVSRRDSAEI